MKDLRAGCLSVGRTWSNGGEVRGQLVRRDEVIIGEI